jgi:hypothetical protein
MSFSKRRRAHIKALAEKRKAECWGRREPFFPFWNAAKSWVETGTLETNGWGENISDEQVNQLKEIWNGRAKWVEAKELAYAIIVTGCGNKQAVEVLACCNVGTPSQNDLNSALKKVCEKVVEMSRECCDYALSKLIPGDVISFDGAYDHRRKAKRCFVPIICQRNGKVIAYIVTGNDAPEDSPNYCAIAQNMEVHGMRLLLKDLEQNPHFMESVRGYVHDHDAKTENLIKNMNWNLEGHLDPGHALKSFDRLKMRYAKLAPIWGSMRNFLNQLLHQLDMTPVQRAAAWDNTVNHYSGDHTHCPFQHAQDRLGMRWDKIDDPDVVKDLRSLLKATSFIPLKCVSEFSTQTNESLNRSRIKFASKDVRWGYTYDARMACAVLDRNCPYWKLDLRNRLKIPPLDTDPMLKLLAFEHARLSRKIRASTCCEKAQKAALRRLDKGRANRITNGMREGRYGYQWNPYSVKELPSMDIAESGDAADMEAVLGPDEIEWPEGMTDFAQMMQKTTPVKQPKPAEQPVQRRRAPKLKKGPVLAPAKLLSLINNAH